MAAHHHIGRSSVDVGWVRRRGGICASIGDDPSRPELHLCGSCRINLGLATALMVPFDQLSDRLRAKTADPGQDRFQRHRPDRLRSSGKLCRAYRRRLARALGNALTWPQPPLSWPVLFPAPDRAWLWGSTASSKTWARPSDQSLAGSIWASAGQVLPSLRASRRGWARGCHRHLE